METIFTENLFSYGTLQNRDVQQETFGRILKGTRDVLSGYKLEMIEIKDKDVIASSGLDHHPIIKYTRKPSDTVDGTLFRITKDELKQADDYEVDSYKRVAAELESGVTTWVYVGSA